MFNLKPSNNTIHIDCPTNEDVMFPCQVKEELIKINHELSLLNNSDISEDEYNVRSYVLKKYSDIYYDVLLISDTLSDSGDLISNAPYELQENMPYIDYDYCDFEDFWVKIAYNNQLYISSNAYLSQES